MRTMIIPHYFLTLFFSFYLVFQSIYCSSETSRFRYRNHNVHLKNLLPATTCQSSTDHHEKLLEVVHKRGPCSTIHRDHKDDALTHSKILSQGQGRINALMFLTSNMVRSINFLREMNVQGKYEISIPPQTGTYIVNMGLGTPKQELSFLLDTTSSLTWARCRTRNMPLTQSQSFITPESASYRNITCNSSSCVHQTILKGNWLSCNSNAKGLTTCGYTIFSLSKKVSIKFLSSERLTIRDDATENFLFGCGISTNNGYKHLTGNVAGIFGLRLGEVSFINQTAAKYGMTFSYCLPSTSSYTGYLKFGNHDSSTLKYTPSVLRNYGLYGLDILGISVGGNMLDIEESVFSVSRPIIDIVTDITRLPPTAYDAMAKEFGKMIEYPRTFDVWKLNMCYNTSGRNSITIPKVSFFFNGGIEVDIDPSGILYVVSGSHICLAFIRNGGSHDATIFGNIQQKKMKLVYDVGHGRIGFQPNGCS